MRELAWIGALYGVLLRAYPKAFRDEYGSEMKLVFGDLLRDASASNQRFAVAGVCIRTLTDLVASVLRERSAAAGIGGWLLMILAVTSAALFVFVDSRATEVQAPALILVCAGFLLGAFAGRGWWRWAIALGVLIPLLELTGVRLGPPTRPVIGDILFVLPSLVCAAVGKVWNSAASLDEFEGEGHGLLCLVAAGVGAMIGCCDFTLITGLHATMGVAASAAVLGAYGQKPLLPAAMLGFGVPVGVTALMAMGMHPMRHHFVLIDARSIPLALGVALSCAAIRRRISPVSA